MSFRLRGLGANSGRNFGEIPAVADDCSSAELVQPAVDVVAQRRIRWKTRLTQPVFDISDHVAQPLESRSARGEVNLLQDLVDFGVDLSVSLVDRAAGAGSPGARAGLGGFLEPTGRSGCECPFG